MNKITIPTAIVFALIAILFVFYAIEGIITSDPFKVIVSFGATVISRTAIKEWKK